MGIIFVATYYSQVGDNGGKTAVRNRRNFIREKKIHCGLDYMEVDIIPRTELEGTGRKRTKKEKVSAPKQKNLNDKNAKRYFVQLANANFGAGDLHVSITYSNKTLPGTVEEAEREASKYIRRITYRRKAAGLPPLKYMIITEYTTKKNDTKPVRIHHHIIMNAGLDRDIVEDLWRRPRKKGEEKGEKIGFANADRLQPDEYGLEAISRYLMKNRAEGKRRWSCSQNLNRPWSQNNDSKYSKHKVERMAKEEIENRDFWEKQYPGWLMTECRPQWNDQTGWSIYLKLRRKKEWSKEGKRIIERSTLPNNIGRLKG